jgi:hypothetical protein
MGAEPWGGTRGESPPSTCLDDVPQPKAPTLKLAAREGGVMVPWALNIHPLGHAGIDDEWRGG